MRQSGGGGTSSRAKQANLACHNVLERSDIRRSAGLKEVTTIASPIDISRFSYRMGR